MSWAFLPHDPRQDDDGDARLLAYGVRGRLEAMAQGLPPVIDDQTAYDRLDSILTRAAKRARASNGAAAA
jgi:hypothetical protein